MSINKDYLYKIIGELFVLSSLRISDFSDIDQDVYKLFDNINKEALHILGSEFDEILSEEVKKNKSLITMVEYRTNGKLLLVPDMFSASFVIKKYAEIGNIIKEINAFNISYDEFNFHIQREIKKIFDFHENSSVELKIEPTVLMSSNDMITRKITDTYALLSEIERETTQLITFKLNNLNEGDFTDICYLEMSYIFFLSKTLLSSFYFIKEWISRYRSWLETISF